MQAMSWCCLDHVVSAGLYWYRSNQSAYGPHSGWAALLLPSLPPNMPTVFPEATPVMLERTTILMILLYLTVFISPRPYFLGGSHWLGPLPQQSHDEKIVLAWKKKVWNKQLSGMSCRLVFTTVYMIKLILDGLMPTSSWWGRTETSSGPASNIKRISVSQGKIMSQEKCPLV